MGHYNCPECDKEFTSKILYEKHIDLNSEEIFLDTFRKVSENDFANGRSLAAQEMVQTKIIAKLNELKESRRKKGGFKNNKKERPLNNKHKKK